MEAMDLSNVGSYINKAKDGDVKPYKKDALEEISTMNIRSRDPAAADEFDTILRNENKV